MVSWYPELFRNLKYFRHYRQLISTYPVILRCSSNSLSTDTKPLPFSAMPGPKGTLLNMVGYASNGGVSQLCEFQRKRFEKYGPIYSEKMFGRQIVNISDADAISKVLRAEPTFPMRPGFEAYDKCIGEFGYTSGLASNDQKLWYKERTLLSPKMMRPKAVNEALPGFNSVAKDFVQRIRNVSKNDGVVQDLEHQLFFWAAETICTLLFGQRLGFYNHPPDAQAVEFVKATLSMTECLGDLVFGVPLYRYYNTPTYKRFKEALTKIHTIGEEIITEIEARKAKPLEKQGEGVQSLCALISSSGELTPKACVNLLIALMSAGVDTTTVVVLWTIYLLSRNPDVQQKVYQELNSVVGSLGEISEKNIGRLPLLKACVKESMRLRPPTIVTPRKLDRDLDVLGYNIPAGTEMMLYTHVVGVSEDHYGEDANEFVPERWLRDEMGKKKEYHSFTTIPFGYGVRMCLGRRIAEAEIYALLSQLLLSFSLEYTGQDELNQHFSVMVKPDKPVLVKFTPK